MLIVRITAAELPWIYEGHSHVSVDAHKFTLKTDRHKWRTEIPFPAIWLVSEQHRQRAAFSLCALAWLLLGNCRRKPRGMNNASV